MKYTLAIAALFASAQAIKFDTAEGPTKADNGEDEPAVVGREADIANGVKASGWTNPLGWADSGADDDSVLVQINRNKKDTYDNDENTVSQYDDMHHYQKFDWGVDGVKSAYGLVQRARKDAYDGDTNTVSQYDDMHQYKKFDWGQD
tara:strand:- start:465 stop:905 length:441 start_codon:yes stop_codon:yes gene_type:complete